MGSSSRVHYAPGPGRVTRVRGRSRPSTCPGVERRRVARPHRRVLRQQPPRGPATHRPYRPRMDFGWTLNSPGRGIPFDWYSVRWTGSLTAPPDGRETHRHRRQRWLPALAGRPARDRQLEKAVVRDAHRRCHAETGRTHDIRFEYFESTGNARVRLVWDAGVTDDGGGEDQTRPWRSQGLEVAVVVAGIEEGEFRDRAFLKLPGHQEELIREVAATGKRIVVVIDRWQRDHDVALDRSSRCRDAGLVSGRDGRHRRGRRAVRRPQSCGPAARDVSHDRRPAAALLQPQTYRPW